MVRASTAAPTYFEREKIRVTDDVEGAFVGGVRRLQRWTAPMYKLVEIGKAAADRIEDKHFGRDFDIE